MNAGVARVVPADPRARRLAGAGAVVGVELLAVVAYAALAPGSVTEPRYVVYPFLWMNVGLLAVWGTSPPAATRRRGAVAAGLAAGYFGVLAYLTGLFAVYPPGADPLVTGWQVTMSPPGWGPRIGYVAEAFHVYLVPYRLVGYLALAYLVYAAVLDAFGDALPAAVGVGSCVSCTLPLVAPQLAGLAGGSAGLATAVSGASVDLSTALFCAAVGLLYWHPVPGLQD